MTSSSRAVLAPLYEQVRNATLALVAPLAPEDCVVQTMPDVSPTKWHLAHTSWFFERFVLESALARSYRPFDSRYEFLFNSYYNAIGPQYPRHQRGHVSRPTLREVVEYRRHVDRSMRQLLEEAPADLVESHAFAIELGLNHEEQHQELILTDIKHVLCTNPLRPAYAATPAVAGTETALEWLPFDGGLIELGKDGAGFSFDNERPRHKVHLENFEIASRLVTAGEYLAFIRDGGYRRPELWLSDGWSACQREQWFAPLYWVSTGDDFTMLTLSGARPLALFEPVCHVSYYEADAFARWAGARLLTEAEWERAAASAPVTGNFVESGFLHPMPSARVAGAAPAAAQLFGDVWEWTASPYLPYPGYQPFDGAFGEYNGKFMCNQLVLRGGSCATPGRHISASYRNFFPPDARWQFSGIRLARSPHRAPGAPA
jgi:ergothioneine biosynthesis protein EgtB